MQHKIAWILNSKDSNIASTRYRCLYPLAWIERTGKYKNLVLDQRDYFLLEPDIKTIIFVKSFSSRDLKLANKAKAMNIKIIIDLCDNIFCKKNHLSLLDDFTKAEIFKQNINFQDIAKVADYITTTNDALRNLIISNLSSTQVPVLVIPDSTETPADLEFIKYFNAHKKDFSYPLAKYIPRKMLDFIVEPSTLITIPRFFKFILFKLFQASKSMLKNRVKSKAKNLTLSKNILSHMPSVLWFGNSGEENVYGITDLLLIRRELENVFNIKEFCLTICTDDMTKYEKHIRSFRVNSRFVKWSHESLSKELQKATVVLIPNPLNDFTIGKSANRALLAFDFAIPVIATPTEALKPFYTLIYLNDWEENLINILSSPNIFSELVEKKWNQIRDEFNSQKTAELWLKILNETAI